MTTVEGPLPAVVATNRRPGRISLPIDVWRRRIIIGIVLLYAAILILAPIGALISGAFEEGLGAVVTALSQQVVLNAFGRTIGIAIFVVIVHSICGLALTWVLVRHRFPGRNLLNSLVNLPFAVSSVVVGYMLLLLFGRDGILGPWLDSMGIKVAYAMPGMILATLFVTLPFMVRELIPVLEAFGLEQEFAAATLGASGWQTFWLVTFPALRWGFIYGVVLTFARALGEFGAVLVIGGAVQGQTETTTLYIYRALDGRQYVGAYSAALVLGLLSLSLVFGSELLRRREK